MGVNHVNETETNGARPPATQEVKREIIEFVKMIAWFLILFFIMRTYVVEGYEVQGPSMIPTLHDRERILVLKLPHNLSKLPFLGRIDAINAGDIVVFDSPVEPEKRYVKRVIAKGPRKHFRKTVEAEPHEPRAPDEDAVSVEFDRGTVYVNNRRIEEDYVNPKFKQARESLPEVQLPPGDCYVLGDNRGVSKDSRSFGPVHDEHVIGRAVLRFWPPSKISLLR